MKSYINSSLVILLAISASVCIGQLGSAGATPDPNAIAVPSFPFMAEITGDDVYVRSGPGTNYYNSGKANKGDKVKVVSRQFSWYCIVPPAGSFSWIYVPYVTIDPDTPGTGIVTGDDVRVYAGSDLVKPIHSTLQLKLDRGEKVKLLGEQKDDYYKIAPPTGAYLWVSNNYVKPLVARTVLPDVNTVDANMPPDANETVVDTNDANVVEVISESPEPSIEEKLMAEYKELQEKILAERSKPLAEQDYADIRKALEQIKANEEAGRVADYCDFLLKQVERYELAGTVLKQLTLQNKQLEANLSRIKKARDARLAQVKPIGRFAVVGTLKTSIIFGTEPHLKHYRLVEDSGETICYARPAPRLTGADLGNLLGKKVGLVGEISPLPRVHSAVVKFTAIERVQ
ncbi:MAG: SH3 domain-containing protein [Planctomycetota bacterium]|jgi:uncharacterized protein YgiM (DUF1202 family)